jgi:hypothetical protein
MMHRFEVGKPYIPGKTRWPEGAEYNLLDSGHELRLFFKRPSKKEIEDIRRGATEFGLMIEEEIIFLLVRFGRLNWLDAPYSIHMVPPDRRPDLTTELGPETRALLQCFLVDASSGILHVLRAVSLSPEFTRELYAAIGGQKKQPVTPDAYRRAVDRVYLRYSTEHMVQRTVIKCRGGD